MPSGFGLCISRYRFSFSQVSFLRDTDIADYLTAR